MLIAPLLIGALILWLATRAKSPVSMADEALADAKMVLQNNAAGVELLRVYGEKHPSAQTEINQIATHLTYGTAYEQDMVIEMARLKAYNLYVADGGTKTFEDFDHLSQMDEKYAVIIREAKYITYDKEAQELNLLGGERAVEYLEGKSGSWQLKAAYSRLDPTYVPTMTQAEAEAWKKATSAPIPSEITIEAAQPEQPAPEPSTPGIPDQSVAPTPTYTQDFYTQDFVYTPPTVIEAAVVDQSSDPVPWLDPFS